MSSHKPEDGIGARGRETPQHWAALRRAERLGHEAPGTADRLMAEAAEHDHKLNQKGRVKWRGL